MNAELGISLNLKSIPISFDVDDFSMNSTTRRCHCKFTTNKLNKQQYRLKFYALIIHALEHIVAGQDAQLTRLAQIGHAQLLVA